jgi:hypothetical protein
VCGPGRTARLQQRKHQQYRQHLERPDPEGHIAKESGLMTDEARHYIEPGRDFAADGEKEYVR